jgi:hypothetical protein
MLPGQKGLTYRQLDRIFDFLDSFFLSFVRSLSSPPTGFASQLIATQRVTLKHAGDRLFQFLLALTLLMF